MSSFVALQRATHLLRHWLPFSTKRSSIEQDVPGDLVDENCVRHGCVDQANGTVPKMDNYLDYVGGGNSGTDDLCPDSDDVYVDQGEDEEDEEEDIILTPLDRLVKHQRQQNAQPSMQIGTPGGSLLPPQLPHDQGKLTVVLDMDETLLHAIVAAIGTVEDGKVPDDMLPHDFECGFKYGHDWFQAKVWKRPGLQRFLRELNTICEPVIFTAGSRDYAIPVLDTVDEDGVIRARLYRESVADGTMSGSGYVKDLSKLGRPLSRTLIIDNTPRVFALHPWNGIVIRDYYGDDSECTALDQILEVVRQFVSRPQDDVRDMIRELPVFNRSRDFGRLPDHGIVF